MDYQNIRKKQLEQHIRNLNILLSKWEIKQSLSENPSEYARSEIHITDTKATLRKYQMELDEIKRIQIVAEDFEPMGKRETNFIYDAFVSFAEQDKHTIAIPLVESLKRKGKEIWCSAIELQIGDSIAEEINKAIAMSQFGIIIFSPYYFKTWPINELIAFFAKYTSGNQNLILPIWHNLAYKEVRQQAPLIADKFAVSSRVGIEVMTNHLISAMDKHESG